MGKSIYSIKLHFSKALHTLVWTNFRCANNLLIRLLKLFSFYLQKETQDADETDRADENVVSSSAKHLIADSSPPVKCKQ